MMSRKYSTCPEKKLWALEGKKGTRLEMSSCAKNKRHEGMHVDEKGREW